MAAPPCLLSPAAATTPPVPGAPRPARTSGSIVKKRRAPPPGSEKARKAIERLRAMFNGSTKLTPDGAAAMLTDAIAVREDVEILIEKTRADRRDELWAEYAAACDDHGHICGSCFNPLAPLEIGEKIRNTSLACEHVSKNYHLGCLLEDAHVRSAETFDGTVTRFASGERYVVSDRDEEYPPPAARAAAIVLTCPTCKITSEVLVPSFSDARVDQDLRITSFQRASDPPASPVMNFSPSSPSYVPSSPVLDEM